MRRLQIFTVTWIPPSTKLRTRIDRVGCENPTWIDNFIIRVSPSFLAGETSAITVAIFAVGILKDPLLGSVLILLSSFLPRGSFLPTYSRGFDVEAGARSAAVSDEDETDPFDISNTKCVSVERLRDLVSNTLANWRCSVGTMKQILLGKSLFKFLGDWLLQQAALVLNTSRRFRYTLDWKKEEEMKRLIRKIRTHAQVIREQRMKNSNPMATDNPGHPNYPGKPAATPFAAPPTQAPLASPFMSSGPVVRQEVPGFRPPSSAPPSMTPYASTGAVRPGLTPTQGPPASNYFQRFPSPQFPTSSQATPSQTPPVGPPNLAPPLQHNMPPPPSFVPAGPPSYRPQAQSPIAQMGTAPFGYATAPQISSPAQLSSPQIPSSPYFGQQPGYAAAPQYMQSRAVMQHTTGPPTGTMQGLVEDFNSLSLGTIPGSMDPGVDPKALPKPLQGDIEPTSLAEDLERDERSGIEPRRLCRGWEHVLARSTKEDTHQS